MKIIFAIFFTTMLGLYALDRLERRAARDRMRHRLRRMRREAREGV